MPSGLVMSIQMLHWCKARRRRDEDFERPSRGTCQEIIFVSSSVSLHGNNVKLRSPLRTLASTPAEAVERRQYGSTVPALHNRANRAFREGWREKGRRAITVGGSVAKQRSHAPSRQAPRKGGFVGSEEGFNLQPESRSAMPSTWFSLC